jgi:hypothetical protein
MTLPSSPQTAEEPNWTRVVEWVLVIGLAAMMVWTTLCIGGYLAETMWVTSLIWAGLMTLAGILFVGRERRFHRAAWVPVPFLIFSLVSVVWWTPASWLGWREWLLWFQMWGVFVLALHFGKGRAHRVVLVSTMAGLALAGVGMAAFQRYVDPSWMMMGLSQAPQFFGRSAGMFGVPNSLAGLLELMLPVTLALVFSRSLGAVGKLLCGWLALLFTFAVVLTGSRGGWLGLGGALVLWPILMASTWRKRLAGLALVAVGIGAIGVAIYYGSEPARTRIQPMLNGQFEHTRPIIWRVGVEIWKDAPWLGTGAASYDVKFEPRRPLNFYERPEWTHNDYLNTLSDYGVVGFTLWAGAGVWLLGWGWRAVQPGRLGNGKRHDWVASRKWRLGLFLGLIAYALHLMVDFHTKIPALAFAAALSMGWLLRDAEGGMVTLRPAWARCLGVGLAGLALLMVSGRAMHLYAAEALRFPLRREIDRYARGTAPELDLASIINRARPGLARAVEIDPANGQAWADLAYSISLAAHVEAPSELTSLGRESESAARRALACCDVIGEYWIRLGVALDMQGKRAEAEDAFLRAVSLAPNSASSYYYYAYHLYDREGRLDDAREAIRKCLSLDPQFSAGVSLQHQLGNPSG